MRPSLFNDNKLRIAIAESEFICGNRTRAAILLALASSKRTAYSLSLKELSRKLKKKPSIILYHLKVLEEYDIVEVLKFSKSGKRRRVWGLNLGKRELLELVLKKIAKLYPNLRPKLNLKRFLNDVKRI